MCNISEIRSESTQGGEGLQWRKKCRRHSNYGREMSPWLTRANCQQKAARWPGSDGLEAGGREFECLPARERRCVDAAVPACSVEVGARVGGGLDSRLRGKDGAWMRQFLLCRRRLARRETGDWIPACAGKTVCGCGSSCFPGGGWREGRRGCGFPPGRERRYVDAAVPALSAEVGAKGAGGLDSRLRGKDGAWMRRFLLSRWRLA